LAEHFDLAVCMETLHYCRDVADMLGLKLWKEPAKGPLRGGMLARALGSLRYKPQVRGCRILFSWSDARLLTVGAKRLISLR